MSSCSGLLPISELDMSMGGSVHGLGIALIGRRKAKQQKQDGAHRSSLPVALLSETSLVSQRHEERNRTSRMLGTRFTITFLLHQVVVLSQKIDSAFQLTPGRSIERSRRNETDGSALTMMAIIRSEGVMMHGKKKQSKYRTSG